MRLWLFCRPYDKIRNTPVSEAPQHSIIVTQQHRFPITRRNAARFEALHVVA